jgi:hypothetical protein
MYFQPIFRIRVFKFRYHFSKLKGSLGAYSLSKNQYEANISVEPVDGAWKDTGLELLEEKRIDPYANPAKGNN